MLRLVGGVLFPHGPTDRKLNSHLHDRKRSGRKSYIQFNPILVDQASRFIRVLEGMQGPNSFVTKSGSDNTIDASGVRYFLPLTVTMEQFGLVSSTLNLAESGISDRKVSELAQVISLTDLMVIFEILGLQSEKVHYFFGGGSWAPACGYMAMRWTFWPFTWTAVSMLARLNFPATPY